MIENALRDIRTRVGHLRKFSKRSKIVCMDITRYLNHLIFTVYEGNYSKTRTHDIDVTNYTYMSMHIW